MTSLHPNPIRLSGRLARALLILVIVLPLSGGLLGCEVRSWINPGELVDPKRENRLTRDGRARPRVQTILSDLDLGVSRTTEAFGTARDVQARDLVVIEQDYRIGRGDVVRVSIPELRGAGAAPYVEPLQVSETGRLTLPDLPDRQVNIAGLTDVEAAREIEQAYVDAGIFLQPPNVSVLVIQPNARAFNITGNVGAPGRYVLNQPDFRMLDAMTLARATPEARFNSEFAYIIRDLAGTQFRPPQNDVQPGQPTRPPVDPLLPRSEAGAVDVPTFASIFQNQAPPRPEGNFQFEAPEEPADVEIIRVPIQELLRGQLRYNVVIRPEDTIIVPPPLTGEYYVYGHVLVPGAFQLLPGRQMTVKQAIATARGLNEIAIPNRTQLIRRVENQDVFVRIDLAKIFVGEEPDIYLQPDDMIMVGTNLPAPFIAAFRNAFRVTYGFGFLYDRNFAVDRNVQRF